MKITSLKNKVRKARNRSQGNKNLLMLEQDTTNSVRLVPNKELGDDQFKEVFIHYKQGQIVPYTMFSPETYGEQDAVKSYVSEVLGEQRVSKDEFKMLKNMEPSETFITTAVLRGKEKEGTKLWVLSVAQAEALHDLIEETFATEEAPDITDPDKGFDIRIKVISREKSDNKQKQVKFVAVNRSSTPLTEDDELKKELLENQPSWEDAYEYANNDKLKSFIQNYENEGTGEEDDDSDGIDGDSDLTDTNEEEDEKLKKAMADLENIDESDDDSDSLDDLDLDDDNNKELSETKPKETVSDDKNEEDDDDLPF